MESDEDMVLLFGDLPVGVIVRGIIPKPAGRG
jgi:hypothetical protein